MFFESGKDFCRNGDGDIESRFFAGREKERSAGSDEDWAIGELGAHMVNNFTKA